MSGEPCKREQHNTSDQRARPSCVDRQSHEESSELQPAGQPSCELRMAFTFSKGCEKQKSKKEENDYTEIICEPRKSKIFMIWPLTEIRLPTSSLMERARKSRITPK